MSIVDRTAGLADAVSGWLQTRYANATEAADVAVDAWGDFIPFRGVPIPTRETVLSAYAVPPGVSPPLDLALYVYDLVTPEITPASLSAAIPKSNIIAPRIPQGGQPVQLDNAIRAQIIWQREGVDRFINVLHYIVPGGFAVTQQAADDFEAAVAAAVTAGETAGTNTWLSERIGVGRVTLRDLRVPDQPEVIATSTIEGSSATAGLPDANCIVTTLRTDLAGRSFRGRIYLSGFTVLAVDGASGNATANAIAAADAFIGALTGPTLDGANVDLGVASFTRGLITPVSSAAARDNQWDVQRRRNRPGI